MEDSSPSSPSSTSNQASTSAKVLFLAGCTLLSLFGGVGFNIGLAAAARRHTRVLRSKGEPHEDPVLFATRALGWGTLYAVSGVGSFALVVGCMWKVYVSLLGAGVLKCYLI